MGISPGQRFRFEHYLSALKEQRWKFHVDSFYSWSGWKILYAQGRIPAKAWLVIRGFLKRIITLFRALPYDYVYLYREAAPIGPPVFEWLLAKLFRKKIIYDFDDAIWIPVASEQNKLALRLRAFWKVGVICKWSYKVSVGNDYLGDFARQYNPSVLLVPTVVNTRSGHDGVRDQASSSLVIGWTGTFSTLPYLQIILPVIQRMQEKIDFTFLVIADRDPKLPLKNYQFVRWNKATEKEDLLRMNIGVMPLYDDELSKGKCGFKAIQYMSLGIPAVVSPVGVNSIIVRDGQEGFVCADETAWEEKLTLLLRDEVLRTDMADASRQRIEENYSVAATTDLFLKLFA